MSQGFVSVKSVGGLLPVETFERIVNQDPELSGTKAATFHLGEGESLRERVNHSWAYLQSRWRNFYAQVEKNDQGKRGALTGLTRERWLLPLFQELGYGRLLRAKAEDPSDGQQVLEGFFVGAKRFSISHAWQSSPIHLLGPSISLDEKQKGVVGAAKLSPHGMVQDFLNRSDDHLWGFVSNGYQLRILRDHHSFTRQAYIEFDLESIMEGEQYNDFLLLWMLCHQSRVEVDLENGGTPEGCWLEQWVGASRDRGIRAFDRLRGGVEDAIEAFGQGFLAHPKNRVLRNALTAGELDKQTYYHQLLRLIYRCIFLFVAEERDALLMPDAPLAARERYLNYYAMGPIRSHSELRLGSAHPDLWRRISKVMGWLNNGCPELGLPALGSFLWSTQACDQLMELECDNRFVLEAFRHLSYTRDGATTFPVNWRNMGAEELGSVYEGLLELHPSLSVDTKTFELDTAAGHERKTTGSYYTPTSLVDCLLDSALDPVLDEACKKTDPEQAVLDLKVCDPACGSGHFLVAAARRIAKRLASVRSGDDEPSPRDVQKALRDVVGRCIYGVDLNPMAVELCKVSLWMEAIEPGRPLSFLDSHIQCGNALLGTTPALMSRGIPDDAFKPIEGDDKEVAKRLKKRNQQEIKGQTSLLGLLGGASGDDYAAVAGKAQAVDRADDADIGAVREKADRWSELSHSAEYKDAWFRADAWCAAFVWPKQEGELENAAITHDTWRRIEKDVSAAGQVAKKTVRELAKDYRFFHWHLAFPQVFGGTKSQIEEGDTTGWTGGFDCVLGNPPYLNVDDTWGKGDPRLAMIRGFFPWIYNDKTDLVFYFLANSVSLCSGNVGLLTARSFLEAYKADKLRGWLGNNARVAEIVDFQSHMVFPGVGVAVAIASFDRIGDEPAVYRRARGEIATPANLPEKRSDTRYFEVFEVEQTEFAAATWAFPPPALAAIVEHLDQRGERVSSFLQLGQGMQTGRNGAFSVDSAQIHEWQLEQYLWRVRLRNSDIGRYTLRDSGKRLLYVEDVTEFSDLPVPIQSQLLAEQEALEGRAAFKRGNCGWWRYTWPLNKALHDSGVARIWCPYMADDNRFALERKGIALGLTDTTVLFDSAQAEDIRYVLAVLNSRPMTFRYSFIGKLKGSVREYFWNGIGELRIPRINFNQPDQRSVHDDLVRLVECRLQSQNDEEGLLLEAEIDALLAHRVWGLNRTELELILDSLPALYKADLEAHGDYRTKLQTLAIYDAMQRAIDTGEPYQTLLDPPPADPRCAHPESTRPDWAKREE